MKTITLSKRFPSYHPRAGQPTNFGPSFLSGTKIHTIRKNEKDYFKDGDVISVRQWSGKPYWSEQETLRDGVKVGVVPVTITFKSGLVCVRVDGKDQALSVVSSNDGLSEYNFCYWFNPKATDGFIFNGSIIHFTDFRY